MIIIQRIVQRASIVPDRDVADTPAQPALEFGPNLVLEEKGEKTGAFLLGPALERGRVAGAEIKRFAAGFGMRAHNRMDRRQRVDIGAIAGLLDPRGPRRRDLCLVGGADNTQPAKHLLQPVGKTLIGKFLVGEHRIAADRRQFDGLQHRRHRRFVLIDGIGVPDTAEIDRFMLALQHRGEFGNAVNAVEERIDRRLAKGPRQRQLLLRGQILIAEHDHFMLQPDSPEIADDIVGEIAGGKIDAGNFGAHRRRQPCNLQGKPLTPCTPTGPTGIAGATCLTGAAPQ